jgi:hypothetical protein
MVQRTLYWKMKIRHHLCVRRGFQALDFLPEILPHRLDDDLLALLHLLHHLPLIFFQAFLEGQHAHVWRCQLAFRSHRMHSLQIYTMIWQASCTQPHWTWKCMGDSKAQADIRILWQSVTFSEQNACNKTFAFATPSRLDMGHEVVRDLLEKPDCAQWLEVNFDGSRSLATKTIRITTISAVLLIHPIWRCR